MRLQIYNELYPNLGSDSLNALTRKRGDMIADKITISGATIEFFDTRGRSDQFAHHRLTRTDSLTHIFHFINHSATALLG